MRSDGGGGDSGGGCDRAQAAAVFAGARRVMWIKIEGAELIEEKTSHHVGVCADGPVQRCLWHHRVSDG